MTAVYRGDAVAVAALLNNHPWPRDALQLIGDGLIAAVGRRVPDAAAQARACVTELRDRGWDGDDELADQLDGLLGTGPAPLLRPLPVDLEELAGVFGLVVAHDDDDREYAYQDPRLLGEAAARGWTVVSIREDFPTLWAWSR